ncbi:unnamed protein product [Peniophora sp. CBMAI 1063]|nr:unnamed protein product [Peniophora sp. CBMAI 1063]
MYQSPSQSTTSLEDADDLDVFVPEPAAFARQNASRPLASGASPPSMLPPELVINMLKYLTSPRDIHSCLLVCRAWCSCSVELLWHKPLLTSPRALQSLINALARPDASFTYGQFIRRLNLLSVPKEVNDLHLARLTRCTRLERLTLVGCSGLSDDAVANLIVHLRDLVAVDLSGVHRASDKTVYALADNCPKLQGVNLQDCSKVSSRAVLTLAYNCPLLRRVKLGGVVELENEPVRAIAVHAPLVLEIDLAHCARVTDHPVRDVWTHSHAMREMRLTGCIKLTDAAFPAPPHRAHVSVADLPPGTVLDGLPPLVITRQLDQLRLLDLSGCEKLTDDAIEGIIAAAPRLRNLALTKCKAITDRAIEAICALGKNLHYIHLGHCANITDRSVKNLARSCTRMRYIDLANCGRLTDMSVFELSALPKLRRVGLVRVPNLTDEAIYALGEQYQSLERVHLSYCDQISVLAVHFLLQKLSKLNHLSLTGVPAFRKAELQAFCRSPPADFNTPQRQAFCVYSGDGVKRLRAYLQDLFNSINEITEDETETLSEPATDIPSIDFLPATMAHAPVTWGNDVHPGFGTGTVFHGGTQLGTGYGAHQNGLPQFVNIEDDEDPEDVDDSAHTLRLSAEDEDEDVPPGPPDTPLVPAYIPSGPASRRTGTSASFAAGPSYSHLNPHPQHVHHTHAHHPYQHPSSSRHRDRASPVPSDGSGSAGAFFRTFAGSVDNPEERDRHGALTPELVFAEIGHGRGVPYPFPGGSGVYHTSQPGGSGSGSGGVARASEGNGDRIRMRPEPSPRTLSASGSEPGDTVTYPYHPMQRTGERDTRRPRTASRSGPPAANGSVHTSAYGSANGAAAHSYPSVIGAAHDYANGTGNGYANGSAHVYASTSASAPTSGTASQVHPHRASMPVLVSGGQSNGVERGRTLGVKGVGEPGGSGNSVPSSAEPSSNVGSSGEGRGAVKRAFRNTFNALEGSFFFGGRGSGGDREDSAR